MKLINVSATNFKHADLVRILKTSEPSGKIPAGTLGEIFHVGKYFYKVWFPTCNRWLYLADNEITSANENNNTTK